MSAPDLPDKQGAPPEKGATDPALRADSFYGGGGGGGDGGDGDGGAMEDGEEREVGGITIGDLYIPPPPKPSLTMEAKGPRLIITHIEIEDFKSYAGRQILGPFHKSFSAVVGPNGSGKSNVIDSMLFVFGYRAQRIRSKKVSVLIHNSDKYPNVRSCSVTVHFQEIVDETDTLVPGTEFTVSRTAFKDNSSYYRLNGKKCHVKEIVRLLRSKGIDLANNRFLILQGEVEQIALMKPKGASDSDTGMLEFLEDIIGSSRFKDPIEMLRGRASELDEQRSEKLNRMKLVEREKDSLEGPKNEAVNYLHLENEIIEKKNLGYQQYILDFEKKSADVEEKKKDFEIKCKDVLSKLQEITDAKKKQETELKNTTKELEKLNSSIEEAEKRYNDLELHDGKLKEDMKNQNTIRKARMKELELEKGKREKLLTVPETNRAKIEEAESHQEKWTEDLKEQQKEFDEAMKNIRAETQEYQDEKDKEETELIDLRTAVDEKQSDYSLADSELNIEESKEVKERNKLDQLELSRKNCEKKIGDKERGAQQVSDEIAAVNDELEQLRTSMDEISRECDGKNINVKNLQTEWEEKRTSHQANKSNNVVLNSLLDMKRKGALPGIYGRLGDLGAIDKKYDVAVSTAGGGNLDVVIVDNADTASACIDYLKKNDIGRGRFLALDKQEHYRNDLVRQMQTPQNVPRLIDLIEVKDDKFKLAFYHYLRDTLVARDVDHAKEIAFTGPRYNVVALTGHQVKKSGAMSGGGTPARGKMGQQVVGGGQDNTAALKELERTLRGESDALQKLRTQRNECESRQTQLRRKSQTLQQTQRKVRVELPKLAEELADATKQVSAQRDIVTALRPDEEKLRALRGRVADAKKAYDRAKENAASVEAAIAKFDKKIEEIMGGQIKAKEKKLKGTKDKLTNIKKEITRLGVSTKSAERDLKKCEDRCASMEAEIADAEEKMRAMKAERDKVTADGEGLVKEIKALKVTRKEGAERLEEERKKLESLKEEETRHRSSRIEIDQELESFRNQMKEHQTKTAHWKRELRKLTLKEVPGEAPQGLQRYDREQLETLDMQQLQYDLNTMEEKLAAEKPNLNAIHEFRRKENIYLERVAEFDQVTRLRDEQRRHHEDLRKLRLNEFMEGFSLITAKLKEMYQMITLGGDAELELVDSLDPFTEGIVFSVRPPKKSWKNISNLSGGEKTLSSLALVFALHYYKPTPLYVMDEIDAALDFKNVSIIANYIKERTKNAQFIIISLRSNMFELADRLVGIYKTYNCTKNVVINPRAIAEAANAQ